MLAHLKMQFMKKQLEKEEHLHWNVARGIMGPGWLKGTEPTQVVIWQPNWFSALVRWNSLWQRNICLQSHSGGALHPNNFRMITRSTVAEKTIICCSSSSRPAKIILADFPCLLCAAHLDTGKLTIWWTRWRWQGYWAMQDRDADKL